MQPDLLTTNDSASIAVCHSSSCRSAFGSWVT
jgi:hypothetical protein